MQSLYEITGQLMELLEMASDPEVDQQTIADTWEMIELDFEEKADGYAKVIKTLDGEVAALKNEIKRLTERKNTIENNITNMKSTLENAMQVTGKTKFKTLLFSYNIQKNPASLVVDDQSSIPSKYLIPQEPKVDTKAIKDFLKENDVPWAHLQQTESIRIR